MPNEGNVPGPDAISAAKSRVQNGPPPDWTVPCAYEPAFRGEGETQVTFLLNDSQVHAEQHALFVHHVIRLETAQAVQHWSQWRLQFEPRTQQVTLHWLKRRRGDMETDQSSVEKAHLLQREEGLDRFVILGWFTLLVILEDVRPGDIVDVAYTIRTDTALFPNHGGHFFTLPQGVPVGKYHFAVQFSDTRARKWKSSSATLTPVEKREGEMTFWEWTGEKFSGTKPETNTPSWHISYPWVQVSDFPDWKMVAEGIAQSWAAGKDDEAVAELMRDIQSKASDLPTQIEKAIELVQDDCRYLSVNLEFGGQIPTSPGVVARRRFGDCKDLSFLLATLLTRLGVVARPVLVNAHLRKTVAEFLPMPSLFNHVVVEFEAEGKRRWVDTTFKEQGGGPFNRVIADYGAGLPVEAAATGLIEPPKFEPPNLFDLREHVLLDTGAGASLMIVNQTAQGSQAELLRRQLKQQGVEGWTKQRTQAMVNRYRTAKRVGEIKYRDDRATNRFTLVEVFEINFGLGKHPKPELCRFNVPGNWLAGVLLMPPKVERRTPFLLPFPCNVQYTVEIESPGIRRMTLNEAFENLRSAQVQFSRSSKAGEGYLVTRWALATLADAVPADQVEKHGKLLEKIGLAVSRELSLLRNCARYQPRAGFDELPQENGETVFTPAALEPTHRELAIQEPRCYKQLEPKRTSSSKRPIRIPWRVLWIFFVILLWILSAIARH